MGGGRRGGDHAVDLTRLRAVAKRITTNQAFAQELWAPGPLLPAHRFRRVVADVRNPDQSPGET
ncbi:hypothetical protein GJR88_05050 [Dietzia sp. DQ12-45-1b]|nr:hypothetical protein GJR88_05050 [Dietzia sp. DQ12-45-1b]